MNVNLSQLQETVDRETWHAAVHGVAHNLVTEQLALVFLATVSLAPSEMYSPRFPALGRLCSVRMPGAMPPSPGVTTGHGGPRASCHMKGCVFSQSSGGL